MTWASQRERTVSSRAAQVRRLQNMRSSNRRKLAVERREKLAVEQPEKTRSRLLLEPRYELSLVSSTVPRRELYLY